MAQRKAYFKVNPDYVAELQTSVVNAKNEAIAHADLKKTEAVNHADSVSALAKTEAINHANSVSATAKTEALAYADEKKGEAVAHADTAVANLVASAPATLDTLNEIAQALGNDANLASTLTNAIAQKADASALTALEATVAGLPDMAYVDDQIGSLSQDVASKADQATVDEHKALLDAVDEVAQLLVGVNGALYVETTPGSNVQYVYNQMKQLEL